MLSQIQFDSKIDRVVEGIFRPSPETESMFSHRYTREGLIERND